jgi:hypothetical protein
MTKWEEWPVPDGTPLWPTILDTPLETIALQLHVLGERRNTSFALEIEGVCFDYLTQAIRQVSTVRTVRYLHVLDGRESYNKQASVILRYAITLRNWSRSDSEAPVTLGAIELDIEFPAKRFQPGVVVYSPLGLFMSEPDDVRIRNAAIEALKLHIDEQIVRTVGAFQWGK